MRMDLAAAALLILAISAGSAAVGYHVSRRMSRRVLLVFTSLVVLLNVLFAVFLLDELAMARILPITNVVVLGNWLPIGVGFLVGIITAQRALSRWRRIVSSSVLIGVATFSLVRPMRSVPPPTSPRWTVDGVCLQSSYATCSPCAAATLLGYHGVSTNEGEMADFCLTARDGTPRLGLYRGLRMMTSDTDLSVLTIHADVEGLRKQRCWPVLLLVGLPEGSDADPRYVEEWGWTPGLAHAVVMYGFVGDDRVDIGDPSVGREQWTTAALRDLWSGEGLCLSRDRKRDVQ